MKAGTIVKMLIVFSRQRSSFLIDDNAKTNDITSLLSHVTTRESRAYLHINGIKYGHTVDECYAHYVRDKISFQ